ncbi:MAG TPA: hypothetical protein VHV77_14485 [Pirellulales bacterium]|nr:hypothetical protein [Pirellulales bacterium]
MNSSTPAERDELIDQLSAYLDGELDAEASSRVEQLLAGNPEARDELRRLKQAGEWLDELPPSDVPATFDETTVSMVALAEEEAVQAERSSRGDGAWRKWAIRITSVVAAAACGYALVAAVRPRPNDLLLENLPIIQNLDAYREADSIEFLEQLAQRSLFAETHAEPADLSEDVNDHAMRIDRRAHIEQMNDSDKEQLLAKLQRFQHLGEAEQRHLHALHSALIEVGDGSDLFGIMMHYHRWLENLPAVQRTELLAMPIQKRLSRIDELQTYEARQRKRKLDDADAKLIADWIEQTIRQMPHGERQRILLRVVSQRMQPFELARTPLMSDFAQVREKLSNAAREVWMQTPPAQRPEVVGSWLRQGFAIVASRHAPAADRDVTPERLQKFFDNDVPETERERLLSLPAEEMQGELRRLYQFRSLVPQGNWPAGAGGAGSRGGQGARGRPNPQKAP